MQFSLPYGDRHQSVTVPDRNLLAVLEPPVVKPFHDTNAALNQATAAVADFIRAAHRVLVLVNDYTRPTPTANIINHLKPILNQKDTRYLVALGSHRPPTEPELDAMFGREFARAHRAQILFHDHHDRNRLFFLGKTNRGTDVWFNRELLWSDRVIVVNSVEPHYFAGYTGGRKSFLPGIAGLHTITQNHNLVLHPATAPLSLEGNPVHEDMVEAARMVTVPIYSIQIVQNRSHHLLAVRCGSLQESFTQACQDTRQVYTVPIAQKADIVISNLLPPYDINFYQSQRAVEFALPALKEGGIQITVSRCRDGLGNDSFIQAFRSHANLADVMKLPVRGAPSGWHKAARLARIMQTVSLYTVMEIDEAVIKTTFMQPFHTVQKALDAALEHRGPDARVYLIPDAGAVVPVLTPAR